MPLGKDILRTLCFTALMTLLISQLILPIIPTDLGGYVVKAQGTDIIITEPVIWEDQVVTVSGNIIIENGGNLTLINTTVLMDLSSNGQYNIYVRPGGALRAVENSTIGTATSYTYTLYVEEGGIAYIENSTVYGAGPGLEGGLYVKGNGTHIGLLKVINSTINTSSIKVYGGNVRIINTSITITYSNYDLFYARDEGSLYVRNVTVTTKSGVTAKSILYMTNYGSNTTAYLDELNATGAFTKLIWGFPSYITDKGYLTINNSYLRTTYSSTGGYYIYVRLNNLTIMNTKIIVPESATTPVIYDPYMDMNLTIENSEVYGSTSSLYLNPPITSGNGWTIVKNSILDKGISIIVSPTFNFSNLIIDNVANGEGKSLIYVKDSAPPSTITNAYQVILVNTLSNTTINGLDIHNTTLQPVIAVNSSLNIVSSNITVNLTCSAEVATPILALRDAKITVEYSRIDARPSNHEKYTIYVGPGSTVSLRNSIVKSGTNIGIYVYAYGVYSPTESTLITRNVSIEIYYTNHIIRLYYDGEPPLSSTYLYDTVIVTKQSAKSLIYINGRFIAEDTYVDMATTAPAVTTYFTILYVVGYDTEVTVKNSTLIARDGSAIWVNNENANVTVINSSLNMITTYMNRLYQAVMVQRVNHLNITNNMAFGLGAGYSLGFVVIDYDMNGSKAYIVNNTVSGLPKGIVIRGDVVAPYSIHIVNNSFVDMGGIYFEPGAEVRQVIEGNTLCSEAILYVNGAEDRVLDETPQEPISEVIVVNSTNVTIRDMVLVGVEALGIYDSSNINIINVSASSIQEGLLALLTFNSSDIQIINSSFTYSPVYEYVKASVEIYNSSNVEFHGTNVTLAEMPYYLISWRYAIYVAYSVNTTLTNTKLSALVASSYVIYVHYGNEVLINSTEVSGAANGYGIYTICSNDVNISNTIVEGKYSVYIQNSTVNIYDSKICGGTCYIGIKYMDSMGTVENSTIVGPSNIGVYVSGSRYVVLSDLDISGTPSRGIDIENSNRVYVNNATASGSFHGLYVYSSKYVYVLNTSTTGADYGIYLSVSENVGIVNSTISSSDYRGLYVSNSELTMVNSKIISNVQEGMYVTESTGDSYVWAYYMDVKDNGVGPTAYDGIYVDSDTNLTIMYSNITGNGRLGIFALGFTNATNNYWGGPNGPELVNDVSEADEVDPEEILDPSNDLLIGNNIIYIPYLTGPSVRETVPPWGNITAPTNNSVVFGLVKVNFTGGDNVCVALTIIMVDGKVEGVVFGTNGTYAWNTMTVDDGFHEIKLLTIDCAGNVNETRYVYKVSNVHPYVSIVSPSNYTWVSGAAYPITIYSSDNNPDNLKIYVNGVLKQTLFDDAAIGYITYRLDTREYANGSTVEVKAVLTDLDGFSDYDLVYVKIDNEPPYAEITYPANNSIIGASTNVTIDVGDALAFSHAEVYLNSTLVKNTTVSGIQNVTLDLSTYPYNSTVEVELIAYDEAGNTNSTVMYYTVDNLGPSINITSPTTTVVKDTVWINATANDTNYVTKIEIYINNTLIYYEEYNSLEANISYLWDTTQYDDGKYNVTVVAYDSLGNVGNETKFYYVDNLPPPIPEHHITALLALITASIITYILLRKKH